MNLAPVLGYVLVAAVTLLAALVPTSRASGFGVRTRATSVSDAAWRAGQDAARGYTIAMSVLAFVAALVVLLTRGHAAAPAIALCGWIPVLAPALGMVSAANRAARAASTSEDPTNPAP